MFYGYPQFSMTPSCGLDKSWSSCPLVGERETVSHKPARRCAGILWHSQPLENLSVPMLSVHSDGLNGCYSSWYEST
ncbi:hypothetical protein W02_20890 [Nitrospira sp. KM1]|nr:hypothetical protein W02_20890 [Nitrospira sp. KM1]